MNRGRWCRVFCVVFAIGIMYSQQVRADYIFDGLATWTWQASLDGGQTWQGGEVVVNPLQTQVLVRSRLTFPRITSRRYFYGVFLDGVITELNGSGGIGDGVTGISGGRAEWGNASGAVATRFGNVIKLDDWRDVLPPGQGPNWISISQGIDYEHFYDDPITLLSYTLTLDGTPGDRVVSGAFWTRPGFPAGHVVNIAINDLSNTDTLVPFLIEEPLTLHVVPCPASALTLAAIAFAVRRQRKSRM